MQFVNKIDHFRSFNFPSFFPSRFSDRASRTKRKFISYSWEKYSPNHPPFISRVYRYLSYPCNVYNPSPPLPSPLRQENVVYKRFPLSSASPSFSSLLNREQDLVSLAWRAPQCTAVHCRPRQIPYYAHQRFSVVPFLPVKFF